MSAVSVKISSTGTMDGRAHKARPVRVQPRKVASPAKSIGTSTNLRTITSEEIAEAVAQDTAIMEDYAPTAPTTRRRNDGIVSPHSDGDAESVTSWCSAASVGLTSSRPSSHRPTTSTTGKLPKIAATTAGVELVSHGSSMLLLPGAVDQLLNAWGTSAEGATSSAGRAAPPFAAGGAATSTTSSFTSAADADTSHASLAVCPPTEGSATSSNGDSTHSMVTASSSDSSASLLQNVGPLGKPGGLPMGQAKTAVPVLALAATGMYTGLAVSARDMDGAGGPGTGRGTTLTRYPHTRGSSDASVSYPLTPVPGTEDLTLFAGNHGPAAPGKDAAEDAGEMMEVVCPARRESVLKLSARGGEGTEGTGQGTARGPRPGLGMGMGEGQAWTARTADPSPGPSSVMDSAGSVDEQGKAGPSSSTGRRPSVFQVAVVALTARLRQATVKTNKVAPLPRPGSVKAMAMVMDKDEQGQGQGEDPTAPVRHRGKDRRPSVFEQLFKGKKGGGGKGAKTEGKGRRASAPAEGHVAAAVAEHAAKEKGKDKGRRHSMPAAVTISQRSTRASKWAAVPPSPPDGAVRPTPGPDAPTPARLAALPRYAPKNPFAGLSSAKISIAPSFYGPVGLKGLNINKEQGQGQGFALVPVMMAVPLDGDGQAVELVGVTGVDETGEAVVAV